MRVEDFPPYELKIDIGCGNRPKRGFMGIDYIGAKAVAMVWDVRNGLPFPDSTVAEVYSDHFLEHLPIEQIIKLMREIHRVCKPGVMAEIHVPHFSGFTNFYEFHKSSFRHNSFAEFKIGEQGMYNEPHRFRLISSKINLVNRQSPKNHHATKYYFWNYPMEWLVNKMPLVYETTGWCHLFPAWEIIFKFEVVK